MRAGRERRGRGAGGGVSAARSSPPKLEPPGLRGALLLVAAVWATLLASQTLLTARCGARVAVPVSFALACALVLASAPPSWRGRSLGALLLGVPVGLAAFPVLVAGIVRAGLALGLPEPRGAAGPPGPGMAFALLVLAPVFEELLYRGRLLGALRPHLGAPAAVVASGAAFALPHLEPWALLGAFLVGLVLGTAICVTGSLALCVGSHVGLNLAALLAGARG